MTGIVLNMTGFVLINMTGLVPIKSKIRSKFSERVGEFESKTV